MIMRKRIAITNLLLLLTTQFCHAHVYTLAKANGMIVILVVIVIVLLVLGGIGIHYNRIISQRNEQLRRILNALDDYRAIVGDRDLSLNEQEEMVKKKQLEDAAALNNAFKFSFGIKKSVPLQAEACEA